MATLTLTVSGMSCGGCVKSVTQVLQALPGVAQAEVTLDPPHATVDYDPGRLTAQTLIDAIRGAGFDASL